MNRNCRGGNHALTYIKARFAVHGDGLVLRRGVK